MEQTSNKRQLSAEEIQTLLSKQNAVALRHEPKIKSAFTREQYEEIAEAYQNNLDTVVLTIKNKPRRFVIVRFSNRKGDWVFVGPHYGFVPCGCYGSAKLANLERTAEEDE